MVHGSPYSEPIRAGGDMTITRDTLSYTTDGSVHKCYELIENEQDHVLIECVNTTKDRHDTGKPVIFKLKLYERQTTQELSHLPEYQHGDEIKIKVIGCNRSYDSIPEHLPRDEWIEQMCSNQTRYRVNVAPTKGR